jgi:hypothetical protein
MNNLTQAAADLTLDYPALAKQIQAGLILALCGKVAALEVGTRWTVGSESARYPVTLTGQPPRWSCSCEQSRSYGPLLDNFADHPGRICKHIAAIAICYLAGEYPPRASNVWEAVTRLIGAVTIPEGEAVELPTNHGLKLAHIDDDVGCALILKKGRIKSEPLARWVEVEWKLVEGAEEAYRQFVERLSQ